MTSTAAGERLRVAVLGAGPGGYAAAFFAAERGFDVTLIDSEADPGGVCLYRGCIPSKALLHAAGVLTDAAEAQAIGIDFGEPAIDLERLRAWKERVVRKMTSGLGQLGRARHVRYVQGRGRFAGPNTLRIARDGELTEVNFDYAIVATGSQPVIPAPLAIASKRLWDSTTALELPEVPPRLLVVGGGYIGLEMATVYAALGSRVTVVEMTGGLLPGADRDLVEPLAKSLGGRLEAILLNTRVASLSEDGEGGIVADLAGSDVDEQGRFDRVLVAVGRRPNSADLGLEQTHANVNDRGFVGVDAQRRTAEPSIFAIGDVVGEPMLAHKATHEGRVAVEAIAGEPVAWDPAAIPAVIYTDPEVAWTGLTEAGARSARLDVEVTKFPWSASGRATTTGLSEGFTKLIIESGTQRILGAGIVGRGAGELIAEATLAVELGARAEDLMLTIHAHPTLSETLMESAELLFNTSPHYMRRRL